MSFGGIRGQESALGRLRRFLETGRLPHALLFSGPEGVGKRLAALDLAKAVNCAAGKPDPCDRCGPCRKIAKELHPDVRVIGPDGAHLKIAQIRELQEHLVLKPYEGRCKVAILEAADRMTEEAANALLKTLEEPEGSSLLVLVTANPTALPPTIVSRCQEIRFAPLGTALVAEIVQAKRSLDPATARTVAALSGGSIARALAAEPDALLRFRDQAAEAMAGAARDLQDLLHQAETLGRDRATAEETMDVLLGLVRDAVVARRSRNDALLVHRDRPDLVRPLADAVPVPALLGLGQMLLVARDDLDRNANPRLVTETVLLEFRRALRTAPAAGSQA